MPKEPKHVEDINPQKTIDEGAGPKNPPPEEQKGEQKENPGQIN